MLVLQERDDLAFELPSSERIKGLRAAESFEALCPGDSQRLHHLPSREVGAADVTHFAAAHEVVERAQRVVEARQRVEPMDLIEVDVVRAQPRQAGLDGLENMKARESDLVGTSARSRAYLRREHHLLPSSGERLSSIVSDSPAE